MKKYFFVMFFSCIIAVILLTLGAVLPQEPIKKNAQESLSCFRKESNYYRIFDNQVGSQIDNYTEAVYLNMAITINHNKNILDNALTGYRLDYDDMMPVQDLNEVYNGNVNYQYNTQLSRFWNGQIPILKFLLLFFNYSRIRQLNTILQFGIIFLLIWCLIKYNLSALVFPFFISYISLNPITMGLNIFFSTLFYCTFIPCIIMLIFHQKIKNGLGYIIFFEIIGITTAYFNENSSLLMTLCFPLVLYFAIEMPKNIKDAFFQGLKLSFSWFGGLVIFFAIKWILAEIFTDNGTLKIAFDIIVGRMQAKGFTNEPHISRIGTIIKNGKEIAKNYYLLFLLFIITVRFIIRVIIKTKINIKQILSENLVILLTFFVIAILPFIWIFVTANHAHIHYWFTFRNFSISVWAYCTCLTLIELNLRKKENA